jgi:hypothetical protein
VDQAQAIYTQSRAKIDALRGRDLDPTSQDSQDSESSSGGSAPESFSTNLIRGLAFNLPLIIALLVGVILYHFLK